MTDRVVAKAVRFEIDEKTGEAFLVFQVVDEDFKKRMKRNWNQDVELEIKEKK